MVVLYHIYKCGCGPHSTTGGPRLGDLNFRLTASKLYDEMERIWQEDVVEYVAVTCYSLIYPDSLNTTTKTSE